MRVTVKAAAKINLMLDIVGRLENGYHNLWMVMQSVDLYDTAVSYTHLFTGIIDFINIADVDQRQNNHSPS